ncbi:EAL domain-containing protein [Vibrio hannami]|uniref:bifunctional diguanylate cyclase/phosphodiesterase n=1 Tax=Vibrio hannami TaxID=2717094 RepID=UPI0024108EF7|nr:EAL domain-containing protein [Vibrio hannami]MDG3085452.1 EAL domain-containing protein [Vibrio hannami]
MNRIDTSTLSIPDEILSSWQSTLDILAEITAVPSTLIMRVHENNIEVFVSSNRENNPYNKGDTESIPQGLYCETVIKNQQELLIPNALDDPQWDNNPDIKLGMVSYLGLPVNWPDGSVFGTMCILDNKPNHYSETYRALLDTFKNSIESQLTIIYQQAKLMRLNKELKKRVKNRTRDLANLNYSLSLEIDKRKAAEQEIDYQKRHDTATGLYNLDSFKQKIDSKLQTLHPDSALYLVQIGFTNGRRLQARYGEQALSDLIVAYRERIGNIDTMDSFSGRIGVADLGIVVEVNKNQAFIDAFCARLSELSHSEFMLDSERVHLHAFLGAASNETSETASMMSKHAREAMLACKESGQKYMLYSMQFSREETNASKLESYLLQAVRNDDLVLYFQPKVELKTGRWIGAEALIRWSHPKLGVISNETLIQMAEQNGLIFEVGSFVLRASIEQASEWYNHTKDFKIAVNVSAVQLQNKDFIEQVKHLLNTYQLPSSCLEIEITENSLIHNEILANQTLHQLRDLGVTLSLDDFGTGYASFSYLKKYPFSIIKIDKSFTQNITHEDNDKEIMRSMIRVAKKMNIEVMVEGIEDLDQELFVVSEGCDYAQGYLYGKPMDCQQFSEVFIQQARHTIEFSNQPSHKH